MPQLMLALADWLLTAAHLAVVVAFVTLWIPRATARLHGFLTLGIALSWLGLGYFEGWGYCLLTDLQWHVKHARGITHLPGSFLVYVGDYVAGRPLSVAAVNLTAEVVFVVCSAAALVRLYQRRRGSAA